MILWVIVCLYLGMRIKSLRAFSTPSGSPAGPRGLAVADPDHALFVADGDQRGEEKRRPPLTTLATRLISITRSCRSSPSGSPSRRWCVHSLHIERSKVATEDQASLSCSLGQCLDAAVVPVAAAIEDAGLDPSRLGALASSSPARFACSGGQLAQLGLDPVDRGERCPLPSSISWAKTPRLDGTPTAGRSAVPLMRARTGGGGAGGLPIVTTSYTLTHLA